ncbi:putative MFS transporter superfamily [Helianthus debilis subsp. tardiflorus]
MAATVSSGRGGRMKEIGMFSFHVFTGRWFMVFACLLIMSVAGATYMFALYSGDIKSSLGYDQSTLNLLSTFKDLGGNVGIISGLINEISPPWVVLLIGAAMNFSGYFMIWLAVTKKIAKPPVWQMCMFICIGANSQTFANTGALVTCVKNFPESRGVVLGLLKGFVGLSGAIITQLNHGFYGNDSKSLILFIGWLPAVVSMVFLGVVRVLKVVRQANELKTFYNLLYISLGLAGFLMVMIITQNKLQFSRPEFDATAIVVVILLFAPLGIVFREEFKFWKRKQEVANHFPVVDIIATENPIPQPPVREVSCWKTVFAPPVRGEDFTILQAIFSIDMLILFTTTTFGVGGTLTAIDNLGQIGRSLGYPVTSITTFVSLVSIWNYMGRVASGFVSEHLLARYKFPRPLMLTIVLCISCVGHLLIAFGAYILNVVVAGRLYDKEALKQLRARGMTRKEGEDLTCTGVDCYKMSFLIITGATVFACFISFILVLRTRKFYRSDIYKRFREAAETVKEPPITLPMERKIGEKE